jgi:hypothetical protein
MEHHGLGQERTPGVDAPKPPLPSRQAWGSAARPQAPDIVAPLPGREPVRGTARHAGSPGAAAPRRRWGRPADAPSTAGLSAPPAPRGPRLAGPAGGHAQTRHNRAASRGDADVPCRRPLRAGDWGIQGRGRAERVPSSGDHRSITATRVETTVVGQAGATRHAPPA